MTQPAQRTASEVLERELHTMRASVLDVAAALDRVDRAGGADEDLRMAKLRSAIEVLLSDDPGRAERVQLMFSLPYREDWREKFGIVSTPSSII